jgi:hypothetical protein
MGWDIAIYRKADYHKAPPAKFAFILASWRDGYDGLKWLDPLLIAGTASVHGDGYPTWYVVKARVLLPLLTAIPPPGWLAGAKFNAPLIALCGPEEELIIEAFDQS